MPAPGVRMTLRASIVRRPGVLHTVLTALLLGGCQGTQHAPLGVVEYVDLPRYMGDWYVIANIPTRFERGAHNARETYTLDSDGSVDIRFTFRAGSVDGKLKRYDSRGIILDTKTNATWGIQFVWPFRADYRIVFLDADYQRVVVAREKRDYVWIMARQPGISDAEYRELEQAVTQSGYDSARLQKVPQQW